MQVITDRMGMPIQSRILPSYRAALREMESQQLDVVTLGPQLFVEARAAGMDYEAVLCRNHSGRAHYFGEIIVQRESIIDNVYDLRGKSMAYVSPSSTTGFGFASVALRRAGVHHDDLSRVVFLGSHDMVARAVARGDFDAGAVFENAARGLIEDGEDLGQKVRTLARTDPVPNEPVCFSQRFVATRPREAAKLISVLRKLSLDDEGRAALVALGPTMDGYSPANSGTYAVVAAALRETEAATSGTYPPIDLDELDALGD